MQIQKLNLINDGKKGVEVLSIEPVQKKGITVMDKVKRERDVPIPLFLKTSLSALKYYYLVLTGYWQSEWDNYLNETKSEFEKPDKETAATHAYQRMIQLWDNTTITGFKADGSGFMLFGKIKVLGNKVTAPCTPLVTIDDDAEYGLYVETMDKIDACKKDTIHFITSDQFLKSNPKDYLLENAGDREEEKERINALSEEEMEEEMIQKLEERGFVVFSSEDSPGIEEETKTVPITEGALPALEGKQKRKVQ